jgi:hypothetical protein
VTSIHREVAERDVVVPQHRNDVVIAADDHQYRLADGPDP